MIRGADKNLKDSPIKSAMSAFTNMESPTRSTLGKLRGRAFLGRLTSNLSTMNFRAYYEKS
jgi:hypothetical protein